MADTLRASLGNCGVSSPLPRCHIFHRSRLDPMSAVPGEEEEEVEELLSTLPTSRLNDILSDMKTKELSVVNLDALIPSSSDIMVLKTLLYNIQSTVRTLSLRFNNVFKQAEFCEVLVDWLLNRNSTLEVLYIMGCDIDDKQRQKIEDAWRKKLKRHRTDNFGFTLQRYDLDRDISMELPPDLREEYLEAKNAENA